MVTSKQLCEHLKPNSISQVLRAGWDVMIIRGASLSASHVRLDRVPGGYLVRHGKYHELKAADPAMPNVRMPR
jgi:hypothetical protein